MTLWMKGLSCWKIGPGSVKWLHIKLQYDHAEQSVLSVDLWEILNLTDWTLQLPAGDIMVSDVLQALIFRSYAWF